MNETMYVDESGNPINPSELYPPSVPQKNDKADLLDKIRPDAIVDVIRHKLLGEELINGSWQKLEALQERALTQKGAWDVANLMLGVSSQNVALSNLTDKEIRARTLEIISTAQDMLLRNWKEYGVNGTDTLKFVHQIIISNTFITLKQPEREGIRNLIKGVRSETANVSPYQEERKKRFFGIFRR